MTNKLSLCLFKPKVW